MEVHLFRNSLNDNGFSIDLSACGSWHLFLLEFLLHFSENLHKSSRREKNEERQDTSLPVTDSSVVLRTTKFPNGTSHV